MKAGLLCAVAVLTAAEPSYAQALIPIGDARVAESNSWSEHPVALEIQAGVGTPLGLLGLAVDFSPLDWWSVGAGVGWDELGPQGALLTRLRLLGNTRKALSLDTAFSYGDYKGYNLIARLVGGGERARTGPEDYSYSLHVEPAHRLYLGPGYDSRAGSFAFRVSAGVGILLNPGSGRCVTDQNHRVLPCSTAEDRFGNANTSLVQFYLGVAGGLPL